MASVLGDRSVELEIQPKPELLGTARLFIGAAGRTFGLDEETIADLKTAVSELCADALSSPAGQSGVKPIRIRLSPHEGTLEVEVSAPATTLEGIREAPLDATPRSLERSLRAEVIYSLFPDAIFSDQDERGMTVRFSAPRTEPGLQAEESEDW